MNGFYNNRPDGHQEINQNGLSAVRALRSGLSCEAGRRRKDLRRLKSELEKADLTHFSHNPARMSFRRCA